MKLFNFFVASFFIVVLFSCGSERVIGPDELQERGKKVFVVNATQPFTGVVKTEFKDGKTATEIHYVDGEKNGLYLRYYPNGQKQLQANHDNNVLSGSAVEWYENGQKKAEGNYTAWKKHGFWKEYKKYYDGRWEQGDYVSGVKQGIWSLWKNENYKYSEVNYKSGQKQSYIVYFTPEGKKWYQISFKRGKENGFRTIWRSDGSIQMKTYICNDIRTGPDSIWYKSGQLRCARNYDESGNLIGSEELYDEQGNRE